MDVAGRAGRSPCHFAMKVRVDLVERGDLLGAVLVDDVAVCHLDGGGEAQVDLVLAGAPLALAALDGDAGPVHAVADLADQPLVLAWSGGCGSPGRRRRRGPGRDGAWRAPPRTTLEEVQLQLGAEVRLEAECSRARRPGAGGCGGAPPRRARRAGSAGRRAPGPSSPARGCAGACRSRGGPRSRRSPRSQDVSW